MEKLLVIWREFSGATVTVFQFKRERERYCELFTSLVLLLCEDFLWHVVNKHAPFGSYATVAKGNTQLKTPVFQALIVLALVLDDSFVIERDLSWHVMGRVKQLNSIPNLQTILSKEGFSKVKLTYLGGLWVLIELNNEVTKQKLLQHFRVKSWFHVPQAAIQDFVSEEHVVWVDIEGVLLNLWTRETFFKIGEDNILKKFKVILKGKVFLVRAKELFAWTPTFLDCKESEYNSDNESFHGEEYKPVGSQDGVHDLDDDSDVEGAAPDSSLSFSHPTGFTPVALDSRQENIQTGDEHNHGLDKVNSSPINTRVMSNSQVVHDNVTSKGELALHSTHNSQMRGSILEMLDNMIQVRQSMGYAMEGCMKDIEHIIGSQGVDDAS
nr:RNA-directed DNA polymerase, eukaryota [Tanacetum cinerariifolium]